VASSGLTAQKTVPTQAMPNNVKAAVTRPL